MGLSDAAFEEWLRVTVADGPGPGRRRDLQRDRVFLDELGRLPDDRGDSRDGGDGGDGGTEAVDRALSSDEVGALRYALKSSLERLVSSPRMHGAVSNDFRHLTASAEMAGIDVSTEEVAECIASYRVVLGRSADPGGFINFVAARRDRTLHDAVTMLLGSAESSERFGGAAPSPEQALLAIEAAALTIGVAAAADASLGSMLRLRSDLQSLTAAVARLGAQIDRIEGLLELRLDAAAPTPGATSRALGSVDA